MKQSKKKFQRGMTLIEILIVMVLIVGLASVLITTINTQFKKAKVNQAKILISQVSNAIDLFYKDCSYYPSSDDGLYALVEAPEDCESWGPEPYLKNGKIPKDPWNNPLIYTYLDEFNDFEVQSLGADRKEGGKNYGTDISSKDL